MCRAICFFRVCVLTPQFEVNFGVRLEAGRGSRRSWRRRQLFTSSVLFAAKIYKLYMVHIKPRGRQLPNLGDTLTWF